MKPGVSLLLLACSLCGVFSLPVSAQSIRRIRQSLDRATGGQTAAPARSQPAVPAAPTLTPEQAAVVQAAEQKRLKEAAHAAEAKVVPFLKERVDGGSADAAFDLAKRYEIGKGVSVDPKESRRLYQLAAERGNTEAKTWLMEHPEDVKNKAAVQAAIAPGKAAEKPVVKAVVDTSAKK
jgi:hypothetical protein